MEILLFIICMKKKRTYIDQISLKVLLAGFFFFTFAELG